MTRVDFSEIDARSWYVCGYYYSNSPRASTEVEDFDTWFVSLRDNANGMLHPVLRLGAGDEGV